MNLNAITHALHQFPSLSVLTFDEIMRFTRLCCLAKPAIQLRLQILGNAPSNLPARVVIVLAKALGHDVHIIQDSWSAFKDMIWDHNIITPSGEEIELFNESGLIEGLGAPASIFVYSTTLILCRFLSLPRPLPSNACMPTFWVSQLP
jgi:hypothetical protein